MKTSRIKILAENPAFISGIYNYCDGWCQRCAFTDRCMNYAIKQEDFPDGEPPDIDSEAFWEQFTDTLTASLELLREMAVEDGIDLDAIANDEIDAEREQLLQMVDEHPLTQAAESYAWAVKTWFETHGEAFYQKGEEFEMFVRLNVGSVDVAGQVEHLTDAIEVIQWYQFFIASKIVRALHGKFHPFVPETDELPKDSDGSAKVSLIAIDRSMAAWAVMLRSFPQLQTETLDLLAQLERLRKGVEHQFPDARAFLRPGFDYLPDPEEQLDLE